MLWKLACFSAATTAPAIEFANRLSKHFLGIRLRCGPVHISVRRLNQGHFYKMAAFSAAPRQRRHGRGDEGSDDVEALRLTAAITSPQLSWARSPARENPWMDSRGST